MARMLLRVLLPETHAGVHRAWCLLIAVPLILLMVGVHAQDAGILLSSAPTNTSNVGLFSSATTGEFTRPVSDFSGSVRTTQLLTLF